MNFVHGQKEKRKDGKSPKRITMSLKRTDDVWYAILREIYNFHVKKIFLVTKKVFQRLDDPTFIFYPPSILVLCVILLCACISKKE